MCYSFIFFKKNSLHDNYCIHTLCLSRKNIINDFGISFDSYLSIILKIKKKIFVKLSLIKHMCTDFIDNPSALRVLYYSLVRFKYFLCLSYK